MNDYQSKPRPGACPDAHVNGVDCGDRGQRMDGRAIRDNRRRIDIAPQTTPPARADAADSTPAAQSASPPQDGRVASPSGLRFLRMALAGVREETNALKEAARLLNVEYLDAADRGEGSNDYLDACDAIDKLVVRLEQEKRELAEAIQEARR